MAVIDQQQIRRFVTAVAATFEPDRIILFGSYAVGNATDDSDVDLLVVMNHRGAGAQQAARIRQAIRAGFPMDLIVRSPRVVRQRLGMGDSFLKEIFERGQVLYEAARA